MQSTTVRVVLDRVDDGVLEAVRGAGAETSSRNGRQMFFTAQPERRLEIIRAIEAAGVTIEEVHTEAPEWEDLVREHFGAAEESS